MSVLRHDAHSLFAAAREDGPGTHERDVVFRRVAFATGIATGAAAAVTIAPTASATVAAGVNVAAANGGAAASGAGAGAATSALAMKLVALAAIVGSASIVIGVSLAVLHAPPEHNPRAGAGAPTARTPESVTRSAGGPSGEPHARAVESGAKLAVPGPRGRDPARAGASATTLAAPSASAFVNAKAEAPSGLAEEARLVTAARSALVDGDAARALTLVQATRVLSVRALEPEELSVEARALRALGRGDAAAATELLLRTRYPGSALAR